MLEKKPSAASALKSRVSKKETAKVPSLIELIQADSELFDFIKLVRDQDLRQQAYEAISKRISGPLH